eukprot:4523-Heterococcus_DN1.PRE.4
MFLLVLTPAAEDSLRSQDTACKALDGAKSDELQPLKSSLVYARAKKLSPATGTSTVNTAAVHTIHFDDPGTYEYVCTFGGSGGHCTRGMYQQVIVEPQDADPSGYYP